MFSRILKFITAMKKSIFLILLCVSVTSSAQFPDLKKQLNNIIKTTPTSSTIKNDENVEGLKSSLNIGIEKAVSKLGVENGFLNDAVLKILLPPEAKPILENLKLVPGGQNLVDKTTLSLNRSAEDAVKSATPIFVSAIKKMNITDAMNIIFGKENAATEYLKKTTSAELKSAFAPKVKESLGKPLVGNVSTNQAWNSLTEKYNSVAGSTIGKMGGLKTVNANLENYVTDKALEGLFIKIAEEEKNIRTNPAARVTDILKKVFGQLDKK